MRRTVVGGNPSSTVRMLAGRFADPHLPISGDVVRIRRATHIHQHEAIMASDAGFAQYVCEQLRDVGGVTSRKMFGEYAIYVGAKVVAFVCDDRLYLKPTAAGRALLGTPVEEPPYPGARPHFVVDEHLDDAEFLAALVRATEGELPEPKPKKPKKPRKPGAG